MNGLSSLARQFVGRGALADWLGPSDTDVDVKWTSEHQRARLVYQTLLYLQDAVIPRLPRHEGEWLDLLEQQMHRLVSYADRPTAHTDWAATISKFGRYPTVAYIERRPYGTFDTPLTRTLKWFFAAIDRAEQSVERAFGHRALSKEAARRLERGAALPEVQGAASVEALDEHELSACRSAGGAWAMIAASARRLAIMRRGNGEQQLQALAPILPSLDEGVFELAVLGAAVVAIQDAVPALLWQSRTPIASATTGAPCLIGQSTDANWACYFQTAPARYRATTGPYQSLSGAVRQSAGVLRPDIWLLLEQPAKTTEVMVECKYSDDPEYLTAGVTQLLAYATEFPPIAGVNRVHMLVCPDSVVVAPRSWDEQFAIGTPSDLATLIEACCVGVPSTTLRNWR